MRDEQKINEQFNKTGASLRRVLFLFVMVPLILTNITPLVYWQAVVAALLLNITYQIGKTIKRYYEGKKQKN